MIPFMAASQSWNPLRITLIGGVTLLWLLCFISLFARDKRKKKLRHLEKQRQTADFVEKRSHPRISYPMFVLYRILGPKAGPEAMMASNARNLSQSGILLEVKQDLSIGTRLELKLTLSGKSKSLLLQGVVRRSDCISPAGTYTVGVGLDIVHTEDRERLAEFIEQERLREEMA